MRGQLSQKEMTRVMQALDEVLEKSLAILEKRPTEDAPAGGEEELPEKLDRLSEETV
ncbi:MAG: hypothetical protein JO273_15520 [Methylobacteriaceae bacterium]|nr:hypothetical protein [Methylobacteriaceae bacterium]